MTESNSGGEAGGTSGASGSGNPADHVREAFSALPLDQKLSTLFKIELDMLGEAVDTVVSAASKVVDDIAKACECSEQTASATQGAAGSAPAS